MSPLKRVCDAYGKQFKKDPAFIVSAPGRVNLIGDHTDYNDGFVLPMAIDRSVTIAFHATPDDRVSIVSLNYDEAAEFDLRHFSKGENHFIEYAKGMAWALQEAGYPLGGISGFVYGDVPIGAGLSSSAAFELAFARAFAAVAGIKWDPVAMAKLAQKAENNWIGVACGIMDPLISAAGTKGHALLIDCRTSDLTQVPIPEDCAVMVLDTKTRRGLVDSAYNERREQCQMAARYLGQTVLRDVPPENLESRLSALDPVVASRARHVVTENERTLQAAQAMKNNTPKRLGELMGLSHQSLKNDFEVVNEALDVMVACARNISACYGARMTGAGFGGGAVALVVKQESETFAKAVSACYEKQTGIPPAIYHCEASDGASLIPSK